MRKSILDLNDSIYINREFANGSIYHKKLEMVYDVDDYNLYHFEKLGGLERIYKVCLPYPKETLVNTKIIQGMKLSFGGKFRENAWRHAMSCYAHCMYDYGSLSYVFFKSFH